MKIGNLSVQKIWQDFCSIASYFLNIQIIKNYVGKEEIFPYTSRFLRLV